MRKILSISIALCVLALSFVVGTSSRVSIRLEPGSFLSGPIRSVGHGAFFGPNGQELEPDAALIKEAQKYYIDGLIRAARSEQTRLIDDEIDRTIELINSLVDDEILANALLIDWLTEKAQPDRMTQITMAQITSVNNALRWFYYLYILGKPRPLEDRWTKGIDPNIAIRLEASGIPTTVFLKTSAGGEAYIRECRNAGVPVPQAMFSNEWELQGIFDNEFISESSDAELWFHQSTSPQGVCLALPRYPGGKCGSSSEACLLGIICLGTQTNKTCFFDNPNGRAFARGVQVSINEFVGGADLVANGQGTCTDCHAGENPYVVHPEKPPFAALPLASMQPGGWPAPLVVASWPQNPGPTNLLDAVSSPGRCDSCHRVGSAGRFPDVSTELKDYCGTVLATAVGTSAKRTMPPFGMDRSQFTAHITALQNACGAPPTGGGVVVPVDFPDNQAFVSPPIVIDPCYQCATKVAVRGAILDAEVELFIDGASAGTRIARSPNREEFDVPSLTAGAVITATQKFNGALSNPSAPVTVRDHTVDFPGGLPAPQIDPTLIHECGDIIAVRHVPGAILTVLTNGGSPVRVSTSTDYSAISPGKRPFAIGDSFTAEAQLCSDGSPPSAPESAVAAPATMPGLRLNPATVYTGQELVTIENIVYGARVNLDEATFGSLGSFTWPVSWFPDFDVASRLGRPLAVGDRLITSQMLCTAGPKVEIPEAVDCGELPAPRIRHPLVGDNFVVATQSVPGARIRVYDNTGDELGDGSGTVIMLRRSITGTDIITVVQQVGECTSSTGYRISVRNIAQAND